MGESKSEANVLIMKKSFLKHQWESAVLQEDDTLSGVL